MQGQGQGQSGVDDEEEGATALLLRDLESGAAESV